jgi:putative mRNA 3-end processing factor
MKFIFHGGAREVGRSCIELQTSGDRYLLDAGIKFREDGFDFPAKVFELKAVNALFLSHAHLDHSGGLPLFEHYDLICPIFTTTLTRDLSKIMLKDSYKVARIRHLHPAYNNTDLKKIKKSIKLVTFDKRYSFRKVFFTFFNAGHIPGSASIMIEAEEKKILYTGDFNTNQTMLMKPAAKQYKDIDILITEGTYGNRELEDRDKLLADFLDTVAATIKHGGSVLIPVFAIGRAQEVLIMLSKRKWDVPIVMDGLATKITSRIIANPLDQLNQSKELIEAFSKVEHIGTDRHRKIIMQKQAIIITTSGMVQGGPVLEYVENMWGNPKNSILLMGYQCKRTNGRHLIENGYLYIHGWKTYVKCLVKKYDFSGHIDRDSLQEFIKAVDPKILIIQHGDEDQLLPLADWAKKNVKAEVFIPRVDEEYEF